MESEYEVCAWIPNKNSYEYSFYWSGDTLEEALEQMDKARNEGYKYIKLEWRP